MSDSENVAIYRRFIADGVGIGRLDVIDELFASGIEVPTVAPDFEPTADGLRQMNQAFRAGFPDLKAEILEVFENGPWVAARLRWSGTNTGELFGRAPTHRFAQTTEIEIVRIENARIVEVRQVADVATLMSQLES